MEVEGKGGKTQNWEGAEDEWSQSKPTRNKEKSDTHTKKKGNERRKCLALYPQEFYINEKPSQ